MADRDKILKQIIRKLTIEKWWDCESGRVTSFRLPRCPWCGQVYDPKSPGNDSRWVLYPDAACGLSMAVSGGRWELICQNCGWSAVFTELSSSKE